MSLAPNASYYTASFTGPNNQPGTGRADGWNEILLSGSDPVAVKFVVSASPATLHGVVSAPGRDAVPGAPVFLEAYDPDSHRRLMEVRTTRTDVRGQYHFYGLAPGNYRVLSSFEFQSPDAAAMEAALPRAVKLEESRDAAVDLSLYVIP